MVIACLLEKDKESGEIVFVVVKKFVIFLMFLAKFYHGDHHFCGCLSDSELDAGGKVVIDCFGAPL